MTTTNQDRLCADRKEREMNDNRIADERKPIFKEDTLAILAANKEKQS